MQVSVTWPEEKKSLTPLGHSAHQKACEQELTSHTYPHMLLHTYGRRRIKKAEKSKKRHEKLPIGHIQSCSEMHLAVGPVLYSEKQDGPFGPQRYLGVSLGLCCLFLFPSC
jgi:hypothetical protein